MTDTDLVHFHDAQAPVWSQVESELRAGAKRSHWMWFIFPQLRSLGRSPTADFYGIEDLDHARRYLSDPVLGERLRNCTKLMLGHGHKSALQILGSPDDLKFRSSITLFLIASDRAVDRNMFQQALDRFYSGRLDEKTVHLLGKDAINK